MPNPIELRHLKNLSDPAKTNQRDVLIDESKQADIENLGECLRALGDGQTLGDFSLTVVLYSTDLQTINQEMGEFTGVFTNADGALFTETYNQLNALFATVPGNYAQNLRKMYLLNSNYADLSFLFTIHPGEKTNPHLRSEYLAVLETDNATPYYLNLHNGEVAHTLILGMTGSGKSFLCNFLLTNAQKYRPQIYEGLTLDTVLMNRLDGDAVGKTCKYTTEAIIAEGLEKGGVRQVCTQPDCHIHHPNKQPTRADASFKAEQDKRRKEEALANA